MTKEEIVKLREGFGLTSKEFARALNIDYFTIARWEEGKSGPVGMHEEVLKGLQDVLGEMPSASLEVGKTLQSGLRAMIRDLCRKQFRR